VTVGTFNATLTITNDRGLAASKTQAIAVGATPEPTASFVFSPTAPVVDQPVVFNADASRAAAGRTIAGYSWNFGDGDSVEGAGAAHAFKSAGTYTVTLTVTDDVGHQGTASQRVTVGPRIPRYGLSLTKRVGPTLLPPQKTPSCFAFRGQIAPLANTCLYCLSWSSCHTHRDAPSRRHQNVREACASVARRP
jgi:hypothetical protein